MNSRRNNGYTNQARQTDFWCILLGHSDIRHSDASTIYITVMMVWYEIDKSCIAKEKKMKNSDMQKFKSNFYNFQIEAEKM